MSARIEHLILSGLFHRPEFIRRALAYLRPSFFKDATERRIFEKIQRFVDTYNVSPSKEAIEVEIDGDHTLKDEEFREAVQLVQSVHTIRDNSDLEWLINTTEGWAKDAAIETAILDSIRIIRGEDKKRPRGAIPQLLTEALAVSFKPSVGMALITDDYGARWDLYHESLSERILTDLHMLNTILNGGFAKKTLNVFMGQSNLGKSLLMCSLSAGMIAMGRKVLYVSAEMGKPDITQRLEANLLDVSMSDIMFMDRDEYIQRMTAMSKRVSGQFIVEQFPTGACTVTDIRNLMDELRIKKNFEPDVVVIDYINICRSARIVTDNSYMLIKNIAEEFRGLAIERNVCVISATQVRRDAFDAAVLSMKDIPESKALVDTVDFLGGLTIPPEFRHENYIVIQTLKTRYGDSTKADTFAVQIDRAKQRLSDLDEQPMIVQERELAAPSKKAKPDGLRLNRSRQLHGQ